MSINKTASSSFSETNDKSNCKACPQLQLLTQSPQSNPIEDESKPSRHSPVEAQDNVIQSTQRQNEFRAQLLSKEREIAVLKEKMRLFDIAQSKNEEEYIEELRGELEREYHLTHCPKTEVEHWKALVNEREMAVASLEVKLKEKVQLNEELKVLNANFKGQIAIRTFNDSSEINKILSKVIQLEEEKIQYENTIKELTSINQKTNGVPNDLLSSQANSNKEVAEYKKAITQLKLEVKGLTKRLADDKFLYESDLKLKEMTIANNTDKLKVMDTQIKHLESDVTQLTALNESLKLQLVNAMNNSDKEKYVKAKSQFETVISEQKHTIADLTAQVSQQEGELEKWNLLEEVYKDQLNERNEEAEAKLVYINELQSCVNKHIDDNLKLKQENSALCSEVKKLQLSSKLIGNEEEKRRNALEVRVGQLEEAIKRKKRIIVNKKKENMVIAKLVNCKKAEIQCIETLQIIQSQAISDNLSGLKEKEKKYFQRIEDITNNEDYTDDSVDNNDNEGEEDSDDYEDGNEEELNKEGD